MAKYNEILAGRFNRMLTKLFSMKGPAPSPQVGGEITPALCVFNGAENRYLETWNRFGAFISPGALAGNSSAAQWRNPAGSGVIAVFETLIVTSNTAGAILDMTTQIGAKNADLTTVLAATMRLDARIVAAPSLIRSSQTATPTNLNLIFDTIQQAQTSLPLIQTDDQEITLLPGDALLFVNNTVNQGFIINAIWRERPIEDSEKF